MRFKMDWNDLLNSEEAYSTPALSRNKPTNKADGTTIRLSNLKRKSPFKLDELANSLSRMFIVDADFRIILQSASGQEFLVTNEQRYVFA